MLLPNHILVRVRQSLMGTVTSPDRYAYEKALLELADALDQKLNEIERRVIEAGE